MTLGQRIQELRKQNNLSQEALGDRLGVSRQAISRWEMDGAVPEVDKLIAMSRLFGVSLNELLGVEEPEKKDPEPGNPGPDRRLIRRLTALCAVLAVTSALSLGLMLHFRHQVMMVLDPPRAPDAPVTQVQYAYDPDYEDYTVDLKLALTAEELKGWDTKVVVSSNANLEGGFVRQEAELKFRDGSAEILMEDVPFRAHREILVILYFQKVSWKGSSP